MSKVWSFLIIFSIAISFFFGNNSCVIESITNSSKASIDNIFLIGGNICFWSGIFKILENTNLINKIENKFRKLINILFNKNNVSKKAIEYMSTNIISNIIGVGNAATVSGIRAMEELQSNNIKKDTSTDIMNIFVVLNTASIQLIPTSIITLRTMYGSTNPTEIVVPIWIVTASALIAGITIIKILNKKIIR